MGYVGNVKIGSDTHLVGSTLYGTCDTAAATAAKVVTCANFTTLITGVTIHVKFTNSNTVANPTLNVNSTGAKNIYRYGTTAPSTSSKTSWQAGAVVSFTYDGTNWMMNDWLNNDTTYTAASATPNAVASAGAVGTSSKYAREDHTHAISVGSGDSNGQVKVAGQNASVKGLGSAAYTASTAYATSGHNHDSTYLKLSGGTLTGGLNLANNTWNNIGDDAKLGDLNVSGQIGIQGINGNTGICFKPYSGSTVQSITTDGNGKMSVSTGTFYAPNLFAGTGIDIGAQYGPYIYSENGNINFRCGTDGNYDQYVNVRDLKCAQDHYFGRYAQSNGCVNSYAGNLNDITVTSIYNFDVNNISNYPSGITTGQGFIITLIHSNDTTWATQIYVTMNNFGNETKMYLRNKNNGTQKNQYSVMTGSVSGTTLNITL